MLSIKEYMKIWHPYYMLSSNDSELYGVLTQSNRFVFRGAKHREGNIKFILCRLGIF